MAEELHKHKPKDIKPQGVLSGLDADLVDGKHASELGGSGSGGGPAPIFGYFAQIAYNGAATFYDWSGALQTTESFAQVPCVAGTLKKLKIHLQGVPNGTTPTCVVAIRKNGGTTSLARTMTKSDVIGTVYTVAVDVAVAEDDKVNLRLFPSAGDSTTGYWRFIVSGYKQPS